MYTQPYNPATSDKNSSTCIAGQPVKTNYHQIDTIRFITISIIVWSHALFPEWRSRNPDNITEQIVKTIVIQAGAISTIIFFIVSGILMYSKLQSYNLKKYFSERIPRVYGPWLFIVCFNTVLIMLHQLNINELLTANNLSQALFPVVYDIVNGLLIYGPYWFVITYLVGMILMISFKRYATNQIWGGILCLITLFYCVNFHVQWIDTFHTKAILAYTFFIWLGFQIQRHWTILIKKVEKAGWSPLLMVLSLLFFIACYEGYILDEKGVNDPFASNRITNIIFSLLFFVVLLKMGAIRVINNLEPRKLVYGIYLVNSIVILELSVLLSMYLQNVTGSNIWTLLASQVVYFIIILLTTFIIVRKLANSPLRWIIGLSPHDSLNPKQHNLK